MVPEDWRITLLEDVSDRIMVGIASAATHAYSPTGVRMLRNLNIREGSIDPSDILYVDETYEYQHRRKRLKTGDILTVRTGYPGISAVVPRQFEGAQCFTSLITRLDKQAADPHYVCTYINSSFGRKFILSGEAGGAQKNVNASILSRMPLRLPPLPEQQAIMVRLNVWDKAIATTERLLANSEKQKKFLMQQLLTGKKRLPGFSSEWKSVSLAEVGEGLSGLSGKNKEHFGRGKPYVPYINVFKNSRVDLSKLDNVEVKDRESQTRLQYGDLLFTTSSEVPQEVGMCSVLLDEVDELFLNSFCFGVRLVNFETLHPEFARFFFRGVEARRQIVRLAQGATRYNISKNKLMQLKFRLPQVEEQIAIARRLEQADKEISSHQSSLSCLKHEKKALMQQLLTGKRRVMVETSDKEIENG